MQKAGLKTGDLVVVDFRMEQITGALSGWRDRLHVPYAESCARQVWYGDARAFDSFPVKDAVRNGFSFHRGAAGYEFLMKLNLGLLSKKQGEGNVKGQFYLGWEKYKREQSSSLQGYYERLVQSITADTRLVGGCFLNTFKTMRKELAARDLSGLKGGDHVVIMGNILSNGNVSPRSDGLARVCSSNTACKAGEIAVTHPDEKTLCALFNHFAALKDRRVISAKLSRFDFMDLPLAADLYDRVFIDRLGGEDVEVNRKLVAVWRARERQDSVMVHMEAPPDIAGQWKRLFGAGYVGPGDIDADMGARARHNGKIVPEAEKAIRIIADLRVRGVQPSKRMLRDAAPDLALAL